MENQSGKKTKNRSALFIFCSILMMGWFLISQTSFGEKNFFEDRDGDGLADQEENLYGTDPDDPDTDKDGYSDGAEVASGYNPLRPAPGDKIIVNAAEVEQAEEEVLEKEINLTDQFLAELENQKADDLEKASSLINNPEILQDEEASKDLKDITLTNFDIDKILKQVTAQNDISGEMELIPEEELNILEKPTGSEEEIKEEEKKQIEEYLILTGYIFATSSPIKADDENQFLQIISSFIESAVLNIQDNNQEKLEEIENKAKNIYEEIKKVPTPYVLKDIHLAGVSLFNYSLEQIKKEELGNADDPLALILILSKLQGILSEFENLKSDLMVIMEEYKIDYIKILPEEFDGLLSDLEDEKKEEE